MKFKKGHTLRRVSKNPRKKLQRKADDLLQDYYRSKWAGKLCEGCGFRNMALMHHFILKSHSNTLRYHNLNLIFLCKKCHSMVHGFHGEMINAKIVLGRGKKWLEKIRKLEQIKTDLPIKKLEQIIKEYQDKIKNRPK